VLEVALKFADRGVVALNAAGSEGSDIGPSAPLFRRAKDAGLRSVSHAGEWAGPENVWQTLEHYLPDHPFLRLRDAGVVVTLNSDDPTMFGGWLADVYEAARTGWSLTDEELADIARTGVRPSFGNEAVKADLERDIDAWIDGTGPEVGTP